jgi:hypothetical protein
MALQRTQKNDRRKRIFSVGVLSLLIIAYVIISFVVANVLSTTVPNYPMACALSFPSVAIAFYLGMHFVMPSQMAQVDSRLLHELAKRKLVEFRDIEEE